MVGALEKHLALIGFMGAGKSTIGREVAERTQRPFVDTDDEIERRHGSIPELFERGEPEFRSVEEEIVAEALAGPDSVIALGGGAVLSPRTRERLEARAFTVHLAVKVEDAWERVRGSDRPLAQSENDFRRLHESRQGLYAETAGAFARSVDEVLLGALSIRVGNGQRPALEGPAALVADEHVLGLYQFELGGTTHRVPAGEAAKTADVVERLLTELELGRDGTIVAFGGGSTTDVAGFAAATYLRGIDWIAVPTTLVGQVDAAIGGKTGIDLEQAERRNGMAEVVKTGLLGGEDVWALPEEEMIRACAAFKAGIVLSDPYEREGRRTILNLGHTFAHALETGSGYRVSHGEAVALGLLAALRLSAQSTDVVEEVLRPQPVQADPDAAWAAMKRDKKGEGVFVLLEGPGRPVVTTVPDHDARTALNALIAK